MRLKDVDCVLKVEKAWTVQRDGQDDSTLLRRPAAFMSHFEQQCDHRVRRLTRPQPCWASDHARCKSPGGEDYISRGDMLLLTDNSPQADMASWVLSIGILAVNNAMMYEESLPDGTIRAQGLLIDFDHAIKVDRTAWTLGIVRAYKQGTLPSWLSSFSAPPTINWFSTPLLTISSSSCTSCVGSVALDDGPKSRLRNDSHKRLALEECHLDDITHHYAELRSCVAVLSDLVSQQQQYTCRNERKALDDQVDYLTGSKRPRSAEHTGPPLDHDAVISILRRTCLYIHHQTVLEKDDRDLEPFYLTKKDRHRASLVSDSEGTRICSSTDVLDSREAVATRRRDGFRVVYVALL
ncbi:hypothetical protein HD554DRAFT_2040101 [Boletus coccyginus]|nr:hypothetical protein HD554DRAFT_2040101 [Boletus coccyginus]